MIDLRTSRKRLQWLTPLLLVCAIAPRAAAFNCLTATCTTAPCPDFDKDGFYDVDECRGLTLLGTTAPKCDGILSRNLCVDPSSRDVFVILVRAVPTNFPADPTMFVSASAPDGLGVSVHTINSPTSVDDAAREVMTANGTPTGQRAAQVSEKTSTAGVINGICEYGTLQSGLDNCSVYTSIIKNKVFGKLGNNPASQQIVDDFIRHVIAHEIGHAVKLTAKDSRIGFHNAVGPDLEMMDSDVFWDGTTFQIPTTFSDASRTDFRLID